MKYDHDETMMASRRWRKSRISDIGRSANTGSCRISDHSPIDQQASSTGHPSDVLDWLWLRLDRRAYIYATIYLSNLECNVVNPLYSPVRTSVPG